MAIKAQKNNLKDILNHVLLKIHVLPLITAIRILKVLEVDLGHFKSSYRWESVDKSGKPIPWFSYPAIEYLKSLDLSKMSVFEYGSGNSTLFWAKRTAAVTSVENDTKWFNVTLNKLKSRKNINLILEKDKHNYINSINKNKTKYEIIVIDGEFRLECSQTSLKRLKNGGFIILDNSEWFPKISSYFRRHGLIEINFTGFGPINPYTTTMSLFISKEFKPKIIDNIKHPGSI